MAFTGFEHVVRENEPLDRYSWLRLGGPAQYFAEPTTVEELAGLVRRCRETNLPVRLLGGGSNVLIRDEGVPGLVLLLSAPAFTQLEVQDDRLLAGGGVQLRHAVSAAVREGLAGLEQLVGIPGTVGGALHGNAGTQSGDIGQFAESATVMTRTGEICEHHRPDLRFAYRESSLDELVILSATFQLEREDSAQLTKRMQKLWILQKANQPATGGGVGRIFKDPLGASASNLIEQAGLKGTRFGEAQIDERHANFIVTSSGASSADVVRLIELMRSRVAEQLGVELETEIQIW